MNTPLPFSRREFLAAGGAALSVAAAGLPGARAAEEPPRIEPGYIGPQYFDAEEKKALLEVLESGSPFRYYGPGRPVKVARFEENFARHIGARFALGVNSGTSALDCALAALGVGPGDEVVVPAYTWWSDYTCVVQAGALPVFADIDRTLNLDPADFARKLTPRTRAVIAVHLLGGPADLDPILAAARARGVAVVEDCAQCVGGSYRGKKLGTHGDLGIYSFQVNKMITAGEGGAVVTNNPVYYERAVRFHDVGSFRQVFAERLGGPARVPAFAGENFRMSELTGAVLGAQLPKLDGMITALRRHSEKVYAGLRDLPGIKLRQRPDPEGDIGYAVFFEVESKARRDHCLKELRARQVPASTLSGSVLLPTEESIINKRARHPDWPSWQTPRGRQIQYGPETCRQTLDIYDRMVMVRMGAKYTDRISDYLLKTIREVCAA